MIRPAKIIGASNRNFTGDQRLDLQHGWQLLFLIAQVPIAQIVSRSYACLRHISDRAGGGCMKRAIFISYRRDDSEGEAGRLYDDLVRVFGRDAVFMDVSGIHPGKDFRQAIDDNVSQCGVLLAIIGPGWATIADASGVRRLDQSNDFVRLEVASALGRGTDVIPVLVHGARMPTVAELPQDLQSLAYRNAVELTHARWNSDVEVLSRALREYVHQGTEVGTRVIRRAIEGGDDAEEVPAPTFVEQPKSVQPDPAPAAAPAPRIMRVAAIVAVVVGAAIVGAGAYAVFHHRHKSRDQDTAQTSQVQPDQTPAQGDASTAGQAGTSDAPAGKVNAAEKAPASQGSSQSLLGIWIYPQAEIGKPDRVQISSEGQSFSVHIWSKCAPVECDMGTKLTPISNAALTIQWNGRFSDPGSENISSQTVNMRIYPLGARLHVIFWNQTASTGFDFIRGG
jgi:hypothetical protein